MLSELTKTGERKLEKKNMMKRKYTTLSCSSMFWHPVVYIYNFFILHPNSENVFTFGVNIVRILQCNIVWRGHKEW